MNMTPEGWMTKRRCAHREFGALLRRLAARGTAIVLVSHDIEFCAEFADRCAMFFDGKIVSEGVPREFFAGKAFYTTAAARMSRGIVEGAVLEEDIEKALGVKKDNEKNQADKSSEFSLPEKKIKEKKNRTY